MATDFYDTSYELQRANAQRNRALKALQSQYNLANLTAQTGQSLADVNRQYAQGLEPRVANFARRGLGNSGLFQRAMKEYAANQQRSVGGILQRQQEGMSSEELAQAQAEMELQNALNDIEYQKQRQIISDAAALANFAPFSGLIG